MVSTYIINLLDFGETVNIFDTSKKQNRYTKRQESSLYNLPFRNTHSVYSFFL